MREIWRERKIRVKDERKMERDGDTERERERSYSVGGCRQRGSLYGGPLVDTVVPQYNLSRVGPSHYKVRVEFRKTAGHHRGLNKTIRRQTFYKSLKSPHLSSYSH